MRILIVSTLFGDAEFGACDLLWRDTAMLAAAAGHAVHVSGKGGAEYQRLAHCGVDVHIRRDRWGRSKPRRIVRRLGLEQRSADRQLARIAPDVVLLSHGGAYDVLTDPGVIQQTANWCRRHGVPYIPLVHSNEPRSVNAVGRATALGYFGGAAERLSVSRQIQDLFETQLEQPMPMTLVGNPIRDVLHLLGHPLPWPDSSNMLLASVGRLDVSTKGHDILMQALKPLIHEDLHLTIYGDGPDAEVIRSLALKAGASGKIEMLGHRPLEEIWSRQHLLVVSSRFEGGPLTILEAMLAERPVVATPVGGAPDWILDGTTGWLADSVGPEALEQALRRAVADRHRWREMGQAARARALGIVDQDPAGTLLQILQRVTS